MEAILSAVDLTTYSGTPQDFMQTSVDTLARQMVVGALSVPLGRVFRLGEIVEAHRVMEASSAGGKVVVLT